MAIVHEQLRLKIAFQIFHLKNLNKYIKNYKKLKS